MRRSTMMSTSFPYTGSTFLQMYELEKERERKEKEKQEKESNSANKI